MLSYNQTFYTVVYYLLYSQDYIIFLFVAKP